MYDPTSSKERCERLLAAVRQIFPDAIAVVETPLGYRVSQARSAHLLPDDWCRSVLAQDGPNSHPVEGDSGD